MISKLIVPVLLQLAGVAVIIAEFVLPSAGVLTVVALGIFGYSLYLVFTDISVGAGMVFVLIDIITIPILVLIGIKILARSSSVSLRSSLQKGDGAETVSSLLGTEGVTISDLRPAGVALIEGRRRDVVSKGEFIPKDTQVKVVASEGYRIVVRQKV